jgi:hypothetical protein
MGVDAPPVHAARGFEICKGRYHMSTNFQQNRSETSECAHNNPSAALEQFKERELSRRSDLLLAENAKWLARNHDKLISRSAEPDAP